MIHWPSIFHTLTAAVLLNQTRFSFEVVNYLPLQSSPSDNANPYNLDASALNEIDPGDYLHTRWGVWQDWVNIPEQPLLSRSVELWPKEHQVYVLPGEKFPTLLPDWSVETSLDKVRGALGETSTPVFDFRPRVLLRYDTSSLAPSQEDFFMITSFSDPDPFEFPSGTQWPTSEAFRPGSRLIRVPVEKLRGPVHLYRKLHFSTSLSDARGNPVVRSSRKLVILIHGWNPNRHPDVYESLGLIGASSFKKLKDAILDAIKESEWSLIPYHWEPDASTGPPILNGLKNGIINATEAAEIGHAHGVHLGNRLQVLTPELEKIHFIAHSAGTWVARAAAKMIVERMPGVQVQVTLLDPFIPAVVDRRSNLSSRLIDDLSKLPRNRLVRLENYYTKDLIEDFFAPKASGWLKVGDGSPPTANHFVWTGKMDHQEELSVSSVITPQSVVYGDTTHTTPQMIYPEVATEKYKMHGGALKFYTDSIKRNTLGRTTGWALSLFAAEPSSSDIPVHTEIVKAKEIGAAFEQLSWPLCEEYKIYFGKATGILTVEMDWIVRMGRHRSHVKISDLDFSSASVERVSGGAWQGNYIVSIKLRKGTAVRVESWFEIPAGDSYPEIPEKTSEETEIHFHAPDQKSAFEAFEELKRVSAPESGTAITPPGHVSTTHHAFLQRWLDKNPKFRLATAEQDYPHEDDLAAIRQAYDNPNPFYVVGDFNDDGEEDVAVTLIDQSKDQKSAEKMLLSVRPGSVEQSRFFTEYWNAALLIFNGPLRESNAPSFLSEGNGTAGGSLLFYTANTGTLIIGGRESSASPVVPYKDTYKLE